MNAIRTRKSKIAKNCKVCGNIFGVYPDEVNIGCLCAKCYNKLRAKEEEILMRRRDGCTLPLLKHPCEFEEKIEELENANVELKATVELNSSIADSFQQKICILEKENAELHKLIRDYENDSVEALCKVNDLKVQIEKMKNRLNCTKYHYCICKDKNCQNCKDWRLEE